jgi:hypothetical protein
VDRVTDRREFDLEWYDDLSDSGKQRVENWLARLSHQSVVTIELVDDTALTGNLTVLDEDRDGEQVMRLVSGVHWDDPFPEDAT